MAEAVTQTQEGPPDELETYVYQSGHYAAGAKRGLGSLHKRRPGDKGALDRMSHVVHVLKVELPGADHGDIEGERAGHQPILEQETAKADITDVNAGDKTDDANSDGAPKQDLVFPKVSACRCYKV